ncbi:hypothetical protein DICPUDRAFT_18684, partial [Dictyostelium purpureum]
NNGFITSAIMSYSTHHHLVIRPEDVWFQIINQFSIYVNKYSNELSSKFVDFKQKKDLVVITKNPILNAPYDEMVLEMANQIEKNIIDPSLKNWLIPNFTTTTPVDKVVFSVALMATMKNYFNYIFETECGIPKVTLLGTLNDWIQLKERVSLLKNFEVNKSCVKKKMGEWVEELNPIMDKFIETISGNPDKKCWNTIVRIDEESGGSYISGWITKFCLFDKDNEWIKRYIDYGGIDPTAISTKIDYDSIGKGFLSVPIILKEGSSEYKSEMYAGHLSASVKDKTIVIPSLDWCLVLK